jgi:hypothetical protein
MFATNIHDRHVSQARQQAIPLPLFGIGGRAPQLPDFQEPIARSLAILAFLLAGMEARRGETLH